MEELELQDKPGLMTRLQSFFGRTIDEDEMEEEMPRSSSNVQPLKSSFVYSVTIRQQISSFDEAYAAAHGLKRGEQQIVNLVHTEPVLRQKIVDFMSGVAFAQDANWEAVGEHIYLVAPNHAFVEVAPVANRSSQYR